MPRLAGSVIEPTVKVDFLKRRNSQCRDSHATCSSRRNGNGIFSTNSNITVSNGTIRGLGFDGIQLTGSAARVERVKAISNGKFGIEAGGFSGDAIITLCHANSNGSIGIVGGGMLSNTSALSNNLGGVSWSGSVIGSVSSGNGGNGH